MKLNSVRTGVNLSITSTNREPLQLELPFPYQINPNGTKTITLRRRLAIVEQIEKLRANIEQQAREMERLRYILRSHV